MLNKFFIALRSYGFGSQRVIPGLDGLRAISIVLVLISHLTGTRNFPNVHAFMAFGEFGVRVFFVISGYLITSILLSEFNRTGTISMPRFYFRRTLRLFPASYFLILVTVILASYKLADLGRWDVTFAVTYTMNYFGGRAWSLGHLWSLAVEEQFYLVWPITLRLLGTIRSSRLLIAILIVTPLIRLTSVYVGPAFNFLVWSDALGTGCLLAIMRKDLPSYPGYMKLLASRWFFLIPLIAFAANYTPSTKVYWLVSETIMNVGIALSADWVMRNAESRVGRFLNIPAISFVGVLSYSLYLWQQLFLNRNVDAFYTAFPLNIILAVTAALVSYLCIEVPFLKLRASVEQRFSKRAEVAAR